MSDRTDEIFEQAWKDNDLSEGGSITKKWLKEFAESIYKTAVMDCMVMLEDCSGYNLRDEVKK